MKPITPTPIPNNPQGILLAATEKAIAMKIAEAAQMRLEILEAAGEEMTPDTLFARALPEVFAALLAQFGSVGAVVGAMPLDPEKMIQCTEETPYQHDREGHVNHVDAIEIGEEGDGFVEGVVVRMSCPHCDETWTHEASQ